ncbi:hypothetical protein [Tsuneonella mangrovi]|uniref:hypothetical protein n=1 Tax=Tsuneonella mangrovi TaxID=1982042 RepID=UPI000BA24B5C|nr:hypothetical protein [Tsuneonella mangrovi]
MHNTLLLAASATLLIALGGCHKAERKGVAKSDAAVIKEMDSEDGPAPPPEEGRGQIEDSGVVAGNASGGS